MKLQHIFTSWFVALSFFIFTGCGNNKKHIVTIEPKYSRTQTYLFKLIEDYKSEYYSATKIVDRENLQAKYLRKMQ